MPAIDFGVGNHVSKSAKPLPSGAVIEIARKTDNNQTSHLCWGEGLGREREMVRKIVGTEGKSVRDEARGQIGTPSFILSKMKCHWSLLSRRVIYLTYTKLKTKTFWLSE